MPPRGVAVLLTTVLAIATIGAWPGTASAAFCNESAGQVYTDGMTGPDGNPCVDAGAAPATAFDGFVGVEVVMGALLALLTGITVLRRLVAVAEP